MAFAVKDLRKAYGGVEVLRGVDLAVKDGEIHALLGANGAGKSTLIKCLSGAERPDSGEIIVGSEKYTHLTPKTARLAGVSVVYQELSLAMSLNVAENVFLGRELRVGPFVAHRRQQVATKRLLDELGVDLKPTGELSQIGNAELQIIEIVKSLASQPRVLILDEPTASLTEREAARLSENLKRIKGQRIPVLYVTHRLHEVFSLADRVTVIRGGQVVLSGLVEEFTHEDLVKAIVGRIVSRSAALPREISADRPAVLSVRDLLSPGIGPISFDVAPGEVVGVFGLVGSGRTELLEVLFGARPLHSGVIKLKGSKFAPGSPGRAVSKGIGLVPSDRLRRSVFQSLSADENALITSAHKIGRLGMRRKRAERKVFDKISSQLNLQPRKANLEARRFSGGNQQKLVLARWLNEAQGCQFLMLDEPTQGVDVGARKEIYDAIQGVRSSGEGAVLATSSEPDELMQIADRVIVLSGGLIAGIASGEDVSEESLLALAHRVEH